MRPGPSLYFNGDSFSSEGRDGMKNQTFKLETEPGWLKILKLCSRLLRALVPIYNQGTVTFKEGGSVCLADLLVLTG